MRNYFRKILIRFESHITSQSIVNASFSLFFYSVLPALLITSCALLLAKYISPSIYAKAGTGAGQKELGIFPALVFNPIVESLLLASLVLLTIKCKFRALLTVLLPATFMAIIHAIANPLWGLTIFWTFITHSNAFRLCLRRGAVRAYFIVVIAHSLQNGLVLLCRYVWQ